MEEDDDRHTPGGYLSFPRELHTITETPEDEESGTHRRFVIMKERVSHWYRNLQSKLTIRRSNEVETAATEEEQRPLEEERSFVDADEELDEVTCCAFKKSRVELAPDDPTPQV